MTSDQKKALSEIILDCWRQSEISGFHETEIVKDIWEKIPVEIRDVLGNPIRTIIEKLLLIVSEIGEAVEAIRNPAWQPDITYFTVTGKPEGLGSELADIVIRVFDLAVIAKINLSEEIDRKMKYNATRSHRHGGKRL